MCGLVGGCGEASRRKRTGALASAHFILWIDSRAQRSSPSSLRQRRMRDFGMAEFPRDCGPIADAAPGTGQ